MTPLHWTILILNLILLPYVFWVEKRGGDSRAAIGKILAWILIVVLSPIVLPLLFIYFCLSAFVRSLGKRGAILFLILEWLTFRFYRR